MSGASLAQQLAVRGNLRRFGVGAATPVRLGFLAPLGGPLASWGLPGLNGCRLWAEWLNRAGGILVQGARHPVELVAEDSGRDPAQVRAAVRRLVQDQDVRLLMMLGGEDFAAARDYLMDRKVLTSTMLPSDLSPDTPYLIAPSEIHPLYTVTAVDWLARHRPDLRRVALCSQTDAFGLPSLATYRAAFAAAGIEVVAECLHAPGQGDAPAIVAELLAAAPDILCWCTSPQDMVHALTEAAFRAGFGGQILSCTVDDYPRLIARTSAAFMEGVLFQFPDFDDPALRDRTFFFNQPEAFFREYTRRFPGSWSAVSWEYVAVLDLWHSAVEKSGTTAPVSVLAAMKQAGQTDHVFGPAVWAGQDVFGIDNALVGYWPVVRIRDGKARIEEFGSIPDWLARHGELLRGELAKLGQLWHQRQPARSGEPAGT